MEPSPKPSRRPGKPRWARRIRARVAFYRRVLRHPDTPRAARWLLGLALGYLLNPFDVIPDWIPLLGQVDDLIVVPLLLVAAMALLPKHVVDGCCTEAAGDGA